MATQKSKIMIVDDVPDNIKTLAIALGHDYEIIIATNGQQALKNAQSRHPDLILLDIIMPEMDGFEVCKRLKANEKTRDIPVIFVTGHHASAEETKGLALGAVDFISNPGQV